MVQSEDQRRAKECTPLNVAGSLLPDLFSALVRCLDHTTINDWITPYSRGDWPGVVKDLLVNHYDRSYGSSSGRKFGERRQIVEPPVPNMSLYGSEDQEISPCFLTFLRNLFYLVRSCC